MPIFFAFHLYSMSQLQKSNIALNLEAMKIKSVVAIVCIWMCGTLSLSPAKPSAAERQQAAATMKALAESRDYTVRIAQAFPLKGASVATPLAILRINGNEAYSTLPYWGGGYNTFGNSDGMRFTGTVSDYTVTIDKKNKVQVAFKATANTGRIYQFKMEIFYNGSTFISALCSSMDPMRYDGKIGPSDKTE